jgi:dienelactone hydrolase
MRDARGGNDESTRSDTHRRGRDADGWRSTCPDAHVFLYRQDLGRNMQATEDAWPKAIAFFKRHLMTPGDTAAR